MENFLHFLRGIGGLIVLIITGYFIGGWLFTVRMEDDFHNLIFKAIMAFILLGIVVGMVGIIIELSNI